MERDLLGHIITYNRPSRYYNGSQSSRQYFNGGCAAYAVYLTKSHLLARQSSSIYCVTLLRMLCTIGLSQLRPIIFKANRPCMGPGTEGEVTSVWNLSKGSQPVFTRFLEKITENSERLGRQTRPGIKPGNSLLPALSPGPLHHWWGALRGIFQRNPSPCLKGEQNQNSLLLKKKYT